MSQSQVLPPVEHARVASLVAIACFLALAAHAPAASGQTAPVPAQPSRHADDQSAQALASARPGLRVPGGVPAMLAAAGLDASRPRATAMLDVIRVVHEVRVGIEAAADQRRARLLVYLEAIAEFERARAVFPGGTVRLSDAANKTAQTRLRDLARALGSSLEKVGRAFRLRPGSSARDQQRREGLLAAGFDVGKFEAALNEGAAAPLALAADEVPLPLPDSVWRSLPLHGGQPRGPLASSILADRQASLLYYGVFSMDEETRRYLAAAPDVVNEIYGSDRAGAIVLHGRSLRVRQGRIDTPGGPAAVSLWEAVADEHADRPGRFILKVLGKDRGRLALIYDFVAHLDAPRQAFALGLGIGDPERRLEAFKRFYASCAAPLAGLDLAARPFLRLLYDPTELLLLTRFSPDGRPSSLGWRKLWERAFEGDRLPDQPESELADIERSGLVDAAWIVETVVIPNNKMRRNRAETWLFGQRVFQGASPTAIPQVLVALRGYDRFVALAGTLERLGITDASVYAAAFRRAQRISDLGNRERAGTALSLYQGALVLIERARLARVLDPREAGRLVTSISALETSDDGEYLGSVASWIQSEYLPAVGRVTGPSARAGTTTPIEAAVLAALAGARTEGSAATVRTVEYEGTLYRVDPGGHELSRLEAVRARQGGPTLDSVMAFEREVQAVAHAIKDGAQIPARVAALKATAGPLLPAGDRDDAGWDGPRELAERLADAVDALGKIRKPKDLAKCAQIAVPLARAADRYLGRVLVSIAYACSLGDPEGTELLAGDPSVSHDFGLDETNDVIRFRTAWAIPAETRDAAGRWRVSGSLLALDVGLADLALRRISTDALPDVPTITDNDRRAFTEAVVLANEFDYRDADMTRIVESVRRGRARVAALASAPEQLATLAAEAGVDELRQQAAAWALANDRGRAGSLFSLGELYRLGLRPADVPEALDAWGTSGVSFDGCLCLHFPMSQPWSTLAGRRGKGISPTLVPDLALVIAEALSDQQLPAVLTRSLLAVATPEIADRFRLAFEDDWMTMVTDIQRIAAERMDDYVLSVTTGGPLMPVPKVPEAGRVQ